MQPSLRLVRPMEGVPRDALEAVFRDYSRYVASIALRLLGRDQDVDDIVQDVSAAYVNAAREMLK